MKVLMISKALVRGAYQRKLEEMAALGIDLTVAVPPYWREGTHRHMLERSYAHGYHLLMTPMVLNGHYHVHFYPNVRNLLEILRPDILHMDEEPYNIATWHALRHAHRLGVRSVIYTWQNIARPLPLPFTMLEKSTLAMADGVLAGSHAALDIMRDKGYRGYLDVVFQFGVDPDLFLPAPPELPTVRHIGFVGRVIEAKGIMVLLRALAELPALLPHGIQTHLDVVGAGDARAAAEQLAGDLGVSERVTFHGEVASTSIPNYMRSFSVLVGPSLTTPRWKEQFGRMLIEAMACAVPVIGSNSGEIPHVIGPAGRIVPEGDASALARALADLLASPAQCAEIGRVGRQRVLDMFTQRAIAEQTVAAYRAILEAR